MSVSVSYELYKGRGGKWSLDSAFDDRAQAVYVANSLAEQLKGTDIKLVEERFDGESGDAREKVIFTKKAEPNAAVPAKRGNKRPEPTNADQKKRLAKNVKVIDRMETDTKARINKKRARKKAAREEKLKWVKSLNSLLVPLVSMVWIALIFSLVVFNWESIAASIF